MCMSVVERMASKTLLADVSTHAVSSICSFPLTHGSGTTRDGRSTTHWLSNGERWSRISPKQSLNVNALAVSPFSSLMGSEKVCSRARDSDSIEDRSGWRERGLICSSPSFPIVNEAAAIVAATTASRRTSALCKRFTSLLTVRSR